MVSAARSFSFFMRTKNEEISLVTSNSSRIWYRDVSYLILGIPTVVPYLTVAGCLSGIWNAYKTLCCVPSLLCNNPHAFNSMKQHAIASIIDLAGALAYGSIGLLAFYAVTASVSRTAADFLWGRNHSRIKFGCEHILLVSYAAFFYSKAQKLAGIQAGPELAVHQNFPNEG